jgi:hypothetical protein
MSVDQMDQFIMEAFLNSLKVGIKDKSLPIDASVFYSNYMLLYKRKDVILEFKNSSFKKLGK